MNEWVCEMDSEAADVGVWVTVRVDDLVMRDQKGHWGGMEFALKMDNNSENISKVAFQAPWRPFFLLTMARWCSSRPYGTMCVMCVV